MKNITRTIIVDGQPRAVQFTLLHTTAGTRYYISICDGNANRFLFQMEVENNRWRIIDAPKVPAWIHQLKDELGHAITETESR
jgi:hypothetical protein